jgi:23S rRNA pseudouridine955/2504/2580 synthase
MSDVRYNSISIEEDGQRLDNYLLRLLKGVPKSHIYRIIRAGEVRVNKKRAQASSRLFAGDSVRIPPIRIAVDKEIYVGDKLAQRLKACVLFEDNHLLVVNKPAGIAVHGGSGLSLGMIEALRKTRPELTYLELVHRLDKDTSGCLLLAKKRSTLRAIQTLFTTRCIKKTYWALLVHPWTGKKIQTVDVSLEKDMLVSGERIVKIDALGKKSETSFRLLENYQRACLVEAMPKTGRTHQIRVHSTYLGHPIVGDEKYGDPALSANLNIGKSRLYLHARAIEFNLNETNYHYQADLDDLFASALKKLRARSFSNA